MRKRSAVRSLVLVSAVCVSLSLSACTSTPAAPVDSGTLAAQTKPYGRLTIASELGKGTFDPQVATPNTFQALGVTIFDSLVELTPEGQPRPGIAEKWEIASDGMSQTFYIRKGVKFHDGSDLTGADVKFSMERMMADDVTHQDRGVWRSSIAGVELRDDYTVVLRLKQPQIELLKGFGDLSGGPAVLPKKYIEEKGVDYFRSHPVGSGPWTVMNYEPGYRLELEAMESHWRAVPKFKNVTLLNVNDESTKVAMLRTGELDIAEVAPDSVPGLKTAGLRILDHDGGGQGFMFLFWDLDNPDKYAFGDVKVRKALSLAIDRKEMADQLYGGYAEPSALWYVRPTAYFWDPNVLKADPYNPEGAKKLLAEAGYPAGFNTTIIDVYGGTVMSQSNQAVASYWRRIGVNANLVAMDPATASKMRSPKVVPAAWNTAFGNTSGGGVFQFEKMIMYHSTKGTRPNPSNPRLDELIDKVPGTKDPAEKKRMALEAAVLAKNDYTILAILDIRTIYALSSKVGELAPTRGIAFLSNAIETVTHAK